MKTKKRTTLIVLPLWVALLIPLIVSIAINLKPRAEALTEALDNAAGTELGLVQQRAMQKILDFDPWRNDLWLKIAHAEYQDGRWQEAADSFEQARRWGTLASTEWLEWGEAFIEMGDSVQAIRIWKNGLSFNPWDQILAERVYRQHREEGYFVAAADDARIWWLAASDDADAAYVYGLLLTATNPVEASKALTSAAALDERLQSKVNILRTAIQSGQLENNDAYLHVTCGQALASLDEWDLAEFAFQSAVADNPQYAEAWALLGEAQQKLGKFEDGKTSLITAEKLNPSSVLVQAMLGFYYRRIENPSAALVYFHAAARSEPDQPVWEMEIGTTLAGMGDLNEALVHFQLATQIAPEQVETWTTLVSFCLTYSVDISGTCKDAASQALLLAPDDPAALDGMGQVMFLLGDQTSAERFLHQALQAQTDYAPAHLHLAQVYLNIGEKDLAYQELKDAVQLAGQESGIGAQAQRLLKQNFAGE